ncbi:3-methyl-2-oxobutanoate hydroxymethyltransferase [bacterium]|nr:3-methyl-2-oxobutanoate hydroxymethyltransferase [bacterium]
MAITVRHLAQWKNQQERFAVLTAYDYAMAQWVAQAKIPVILVGDSLGQVMLGHASTLPVTMDAMVHHTAAVVRGAGECLVVADMPFLSYQVCSEDAVRNAGRLIQEAGAHAVKLEGGEDMAAVIRALVRADIAVMGHIGLTPQAVHQLGGYRTQAVDEAGRQTLLADARAVEAAGAFAVVLEKVPAQAAREVTEALSIPTIGIGAGPDCDGQVLVTHDILGLFGDYKPSFVKRYAELGQAAVKAMATFQQEVKTGQFPEKEGNHDGC